jgi:hypothetical protein
LPIIVPSMIAGVGWLGTAPCVLPATRLSTPMWEGPKVVPWELSLDRPVHAPIESGQHGRMGGKSPRCLRDGNVEHGPVRCQPVQHGAGWPHGPIEAQAIWSQRVDRNKDNVPRHRLVRFGARLEDRGIGPPDGQPGSQRSFVRSRLEDEAQIGSKRRTHRIEWHLEVDPPTIGRPSGRIQSPIE